MITLTHCPKYIKSRSSRMTSRYMKTLIGYSREQYLHLRSTKYIYWNSAAQPVYVTTLLFTASFSLYRKTNRFEMGSSPKQWRKDVSKKRTRKNGSQSSTKPSNTCLSRNMHVMIDHWRRIWIFTSRASSSRESLRRQCTAAQETCMQPQTLITFQCWRHKSLDSLSLIAFGGAHSIRCHCLTLLHACIK